MVALLRLGLPLAAAIGLETACFAMIINMSGWLGPVSLATMHAAINYTSFVYMLTIGLATAAAVRVGNAVGRGIGAAHSAPAGSPSPGRRPDGGRRTADRLFPDHAAGLLTDDPAVLVLLVPLLAGVVSLLVVVDSLQGVLMGALRGCADTLIPTIIYGVSFWVIGVPAGYWWGYREGARTAALTWALLAALSAAAIALALAIAVPAPHSAPRPVIQPNSWSHGPKPVKIY